MHDLFETDQFQSIICVAITLAVPLAWAVIVEIVLHRFKEQRRPGVRDRAAEWVSFFENQ